ncbi:hypothetical protein WCLP8_440001 [uncultured Gammaproteobacteria bacterium]
MMGAIEAGFLAKFRSLFRSAAFTSPKPGSRRPCRPAMAIALEPRYLFDAAGAVVVAETVHDASHPADAPPAGPDPLAEALANHVLPVDPLPVDSTAGVSAPTQVRAADPAQDGGKKEVAFIDSSVADYQALADGVKAGVEVEIVDGGQSGLAQMAKWAETHSGYDAIHVLTHGSAATLRIGADSVTSDSLGTTLQQVEMAEIGHALNPGGDLLLYGCDVAKGADGQRLVEGIAAATGVDVAASTNATGTARLGGDWSLEATVGTIETPIALTDTARTAYDRVLDAPTIDLNGAGNGTGNTVTLADAANGLAALTATADDTEFSNAGNWNGATLTIQRVTSGGDGDGTTKDQFSFLGSTLFDVQEGNPTTDYPYQTIADAMAAHENAMGALNDKIQTGWFARWRYTNATGTLTIQFGQAASGDGDINSPSTTALVQDVIRHIGYTNASPYGDAIIRFSLSDGTLTTTADATVTSSTITVDRTDDDGTNTAANGFSLREALARGAAQGSADTIKLDSLTTNTIITLGSTATLGDGDIISYLKTGTNTVTIAASSGTLNLAGTGKVFADASETVVISAVVSDSGNLEKIGTGTLTLSGTNTYTGTTTVTAGTLATSGANRIADASALTVAHGATFSLGGSDTVFSLAGAGNVSLGSNRLTMNGDATTEFSGVISGTDGSLTLNSSGSGTLTLSGNNTYTGTTTVTAGTLATSAGDKISNDSAVVVASGGTFSLGGDETIKSLAGAGTVTLGTHTLKIFGSEVTEFSGNIGGAGGRLTIEDDSDGNATAVGHGAGSLTLSGTNSYTGDTSLEYHATLIVSGGHAIADTSAVKMIYGGAGFSSTLTLLADETIGSISGSNPFLRIQLGANTLTTGGNNDDGEFWGVISDTGNLIKAGSGTLNLYGTNSYTGTTEVAAGTLTVRDALNGYGAGTTTVDTGATLSSNGTVNGAVLVSSGGTLAPGFFTGGPGKLTVNGDLTIASGGILAMDINGSTVGTGYDQVAVTGVVDVTGATLALTVQSAYQSTGMVPETSFTLIDNGTEDAFPVNAQ